MTDQVNHPPHYSKLSPEPIDVIEGWGLGFHTGNALKYIARAGRKDGVDPLTDLRKALWYLQRLVARLEKKNTSVREDTLADGYLTRDPWSP